MDEANSAHSAATLRHFAAEGLRSDMKSPPVWSIHRGCGRELDLPQSTPRRTCAGLCADAITNAILFYRKNLSDNPDWGCCRAFPRILYVRYRYLRL